MTINIVRRALGFATAVVCLSSGAAQAAGPAVSAPNGKLEFDAGALSLPAPTFMGRAAGTLTLPLGQRFGLQADFSASTAPGFTTSAAFHLFTRDPQAYLIGGALGFVRSPGALVMAAGPEAELYLDRWTLEAWAGASLVRPTAPAGPDRYGVFALANVGYYPTDNWRLSLGLSSLDGYNAVSIGSEYLLDKFDMPISVTGEARIGQDGAVRAMIGLRGYIGPDPHKTLIDRHRQDDPADLGAALSNAADPATLSGKPKSAPAKVPDPPASSSAPPSSSQPVSSSEAPGSSSETPTSSSEQPASSAPSDPPASSSEPPASSSEQPASSSEPPASSSEAPVSSSEPPASSSTEPPASSSEPPASSSEPPSSSSTSSEPPASDPPVISGEGSSASSSSASEEPGSPDPSSEQSASSCEGSSSASSEAPSSSSQEENSSTSSQETTSSTPDTGSSVEDPSGEQLSSSSSEEPEPGPAWCTDVPLNIWDPVAQTCTDSGGIVISPPEEQTDPSYPVPDWCSAIDRAWDSENGICYDGNTWAEVPPPSP